MIFVAASCPPVYLFCLFATHAHFASSNYLRLFIGWRHFFQFFWPPRRLGVCGIVCSTVPTCITGNPILLPLTAMRPSILWPLNTSRTGRFSPQGVIFRYPFISHRVITNPTLRFRSSLSRCPSNNHRPYSLRAQPRIYVSTVSRCAPTAVFLSLCLCRYVFVLPDIGASVVRGSPRETSDYVPDDALAMQHAKCV